MKHTVSEPIQGASNRQKLKRFSFSASEVVLFSSVRWDIELSDEVEVFFHIVSKVNGGIALCADAFQDDLLVNMDAVDLKAFRLGVKKAFDLLARSRDEDVVENLAKVELNAT